MKIRAESNNGFLQRFLLIAIVCMGFGLYCLYDGFIAYPKELARSIGYYVYHDFDDQEEPEFLADDMDMDFEAKWELLAAENNWSIDKPKKRPAVIQSDIIWQYGMAIVAFLVGMPVLYNYLNSRNSWIESDGEQVATSWGQTMNFDQVQQIDKRKWEKKGIAKIAYTNDGQNRTLLIDDFKFNRTAIGEILDQIESSVDREKIVGAPTQQELAEYDDEQLAADDEGEMESEDA